MATAGDLIQDALELIGVYSPGQTMTSDDSARGLDQLNKMMELWSNESLMCFAITEQSFPLQVGVTSYTIGSGGVINQTRPLRVIEGPGAAYLQDTNSNNYAVDVVPRDVWNQIGNRGVATQSNVPDTLFYDPQYPLGIINIWPAPTSTYTMFFDSYRQFTTFSGLTTSVSLPPGFDAAIQYNLAVRMAPFFKNQPASPDVKAFADEARRILKRTNKRTNYVQYDPALLGRGNQSYNIFNDSYSTNAR